MATTFKVLSALLSYPTEDVQQAGDELRAVLREEALLPATVQAVLERLIADFAAADLYDLQERYVELFDRSRSLSLYLFEHVHGEGRDRGQAMIDLKSLYEKHGLLSANNELPDFLPLFLEFLSTLPIEEARKLLGQIDHIRRALGGRVEKRQAPYAILFDALGELAIPPKDVQASASELPDEDPNDLAALDKQWEDEPVTFGPESAPSCKDQLIAKIRAGRRPAPGLAG
jgi:nitrate reductase molybdenum cofactor assembly chaperone NarJ/NarW